MPATVMPDPPPSRPPRRRSGRPPLQAGDSTVKLGVRLPTAVYERARRAAFRQGVSLSDVLRAAVARVTRSDESHH